MRYQREHVSCLVKRHSLASGTSIEGISEASKSLGISEGIRCLHTILHWLNGRPINAWVQLLFEGGPYDPL